MNEKRNLKDTPWDWRDHDDDTHILGEIERESSNKRENERDVNFTLIEKAKMNDQLK